MKKIILFPLILSLVAGTVVLYSFKINNAKKRPVMEVYYDYKRWNNQIGVNILESELGDSTSSSWGQSIGKTHSTSVYLMQISFNNSVLTLGQAVTGVRNYYHNNSQTLPADGSSLNAVGAGGFTYPVTIYREPNE